MEHTEFKTELDKFHDLKRRGHRLENVLGLYLWVGIVAAIVGGAYFLLASIDLELVSPRGIALIVALTGVTLSGLSLVTAKLIQLRRLSSYDAAWRSMAVQNLIATWRYFENIAQILAEQLKDAKEISGEEDTTSPVGYVKILVVNGAMTDRDVYTVRRVLNLRNEMVHTSHTIDVPSIEKAADDLLDIIDGIEDFRTNVQSEKRVSKRRSVRRSTRVSAPSQK
jgi:uncharacterized protein YutE (UPF0331/DUF86 family)